MTMVSDKALLACRKKGHTFPAPGAYLLVERNTTSTTDTCERCTVLRTIRLLPGMERIEVGYGFGGPPSVTSTQPIRKAT